MRSALTRLREESTVREVAADMLHRGGSARCPLKTYVDFRSSFGDSSYVARFDYFRKGFLVCHLAVVGWHGAHMTEVICDAQGFPEAAQRWIGSMLVPQRDIR